MKAQTLNQFLSLGNYIEFKLAWKKEKHLK